MNLLGAVLYDPTTAVTKGTAASVLAAFDTTNARIAFVVPPSGCVRVVIQCTIHGATTFSQIVLGCLEGATLRGRAVPIGSLNGTALATTMMTQNVDYIVSGLTPGASVSWDAAWGIETFVASSLIKYGGPNNTTANDAFGALIFQLWDPAPVYTPTSGTAPTTTVSARVDSVKTKTDFLPSATAGAAGGLQIAGSNAATTYATLTVTGATTLTGNVALADGLSIAAPSTLNRAGLDIAGNGTGAAIKAVAGATGVGFSVAGGGTSGDGIKVTTTSGHGVNLAPVGTNMHGLLSTGGNGGTSDGIKAAAGTGGVDLRAAITGNVTGNLSGSVGSVTGAVGSVTGAVGSVTGAVGSVTGLTASNLDAAISSRMASYTQPTGFLAATFPTGTVANTTNITAGTITTTTNLTNAPTAGDLTATMKTSVTTAATAATPTAAAVTGAVGSVTAAVSVTGDLSATMKTSVTTACTASTPTAAAVTGAVGSVTGAVGSVTGSVGSVVGLTASNLDATISSRSTYAGADTSGTTTLLTRLSATRAGNLDSIDAAISSRLASASYTTPDNTSITAIKAKTDSLNFAVAGKLDVNLLYVNGILVGGSGTAGSPWGPG